jgi:hypothetical protein
MTAPIRLTARILGHLDGAQATYDVRAGRVPDGDEELGSLFRKVEAAPVRKDGSATVSLTPGEAVALRGYVEAQAAGAADNVGPDDPWALAELNACRALLRKLAPPPARYFGPGYNDNIATHSVRYPPNRPTR